MSLPNELLPVGLLGTGAATGGYQIQRSLRFNSSDSAFLSRNVSSETNRKTFTFAAWVKRNKLGSGDYYLFHGVGGSGGLAGYTLLGFSADQLWFNDGFSGAITSTAKFRDPSAWYHVVFAVDSTQATDSNRVKMYVNGVQLTSLDVVAWPSLNRDFTINAAVQHTIGWYFSASNDFLLADVHFIDGQALDPSSFVETSATTGQLIPKAYTGSFGTNGFWLKFSDNSAATATTLGKDYSSNGNNWTPNNLSVFSATKSGAGSVTAGAPFNSSFPWTTAFDGAIDLTGAVSNASGANSFVWTFASTLTGTTAAFVVHDTYVPDFDTGNKAAINGTALTSSNWTKTTNTLPVASGAAGDYKVYTYSLGGSPLSTVGVGNAVRIAAVLLDGIPLIFDLSGTNDSLVDTPTSYGTDDGLGGSVRGNYCTWNPLTGAVTLTNGNLDGNSTGGAWRGATGTTGVFSGKWYWESTIQSTDSGNYYGEFGFIKTTDITGAITFPSGMNGIVYYARNGRKISGGTSVVTSSSGATTGDIVQVAVDLDAGKIWFGVNNTWIDSGNPASGANPAYTGLSGTYLPALGVFDGGKCNTNYGARPFAYTAPSGFKALCDTNLPAPVVAKSSDYFQTVLYTGNGSTQTISGLGFSPDFIWTKSRSRIDNNVLHDIVRGRTSNLYSDLAASENTTTTSTADLVSFNANGYTLGTVQQSAMNRSGETYVAWTWDAGTSTVTNTQGSITSSVRTNGYLSIVTYTGNGTNGATVGHGLGVSPGMVIVKARSAAYEWPVYHSSLSAGQGLFLNYTVAAGSVSSQFNWGGIGGANSTTFTCTQGVSTINNTNLNGNTYVAYVFSPVSGYSSFGSYVGNGSASDGPFIYTGFRPKFVLIKGSSFVSNWNLLDGVRDSYNVADKILRPNLSNAELNSISAGSGFAADFLSNGFKLRASLGDSNSNAETFVWAAFAESPFAYSRAR